MSRLFGRRAVVTGGGRGIGRAIVEKLAAEGAHIMINDLDEEPAREVADRIHSAGGTVTVCAGDITGNGFAEKLIGQTVAELGGIDILVNNAGYIWNSTLLKSEDAQWDAMLDVHVKAPVRILRAAGQWFREAAEREGGSAPYRKVINVSSLAGLQGAATQASYSTAKAALRGLTKTLAKEWGRYRVTVNSVAFGHIETRLTQPYQGEPPAIRVGEREIRVGIDDGSRGILRMLTPLGRPGTAEEAAGAVFLFCIPESDYVTGQTLLASGGLDM